jgi:hypothetical protein
MTNLGKSTIILSVLATFFYLFQNKIIYNFMIIVATKNTRTKNVFTLPLLVLLLDPGSWMDKTRIRAKHTGSATLPGTTVSYDDK